MTHDHLPRAARADEAACSRPVLPLPRLGVAGLAAVVLLAGVLADATASSADLSAPRSAAVGQPVEIAVTGLRTGFFYRATLDQALSSRAPGIQCARSFDRTISVGRSERTYVFRGRIPSTLRCRDTRTHRTYTIRLRPGAYRWVIGRKTGVASWDRRASLVVQAVRIRAAT